MAYKWKPSKAQRKEFAENMQDENFKTAYYQRKEKKAEKRRSKSKFDYESAGGEYVPTREQYNFVFQNRHTELNKENEEAFNQIEFGFTCNEKIHHDHIHVINELMRKI